MERKTKEIIRIENKENSFLMYDLKALPVLMPISTLIVISNPWFCSRLRVYSLMNVETLSDGGFTKS